MNELTCPDGGKCHHSCTASCFRVQHCEPLSGTFTGDDWPVDVRALHSCLVVKGEVTDRYHTFDELYAHRSALFVALMMSHPGISWMADKHDDGTTIEGFFIVGMNLPTGQVTYHLKRDPWFDIIKKGASLITHVTQAPRWDGHTSDEVIERLLGWMVML